MSAPISPNSEAIKKGRKLGYARVSTASQTVDQQVAALRREGCERIFTDEGIRATNAVRPAMEEIKATLAEGDVFVVWAIDRAFRSTMEAILFLDELMRRGIEFKSLTQAIDTRTPEGRKWYIDTASWAEYEREIISRRTREKMAHAKREGKHVGRPHKLSKRCTVRAHAQIQDGEQSLSYLAAQYDVAPITIKRAFMRHGLKG